MGRVESTCLLAQVVAPISHPYQGEEDGGGLASRVRRPCRRDASPNPQHELRCCWQLVRAATRT